ncbi:GNAT family N-acetyltransferase [Lysobacter sp. TY2-98]|uniref:GNAT family N-acetyltransferase n=1 Tax=Lysobacter sp. TY2-98 TaxID=2290922 RepID=UPI000E1FEB5C|nr:GNAT family N-acetyltransferase [Lysobacter sp. TY2-98]AXK70895.1 GNAT family N-acetyltransferase [Lysobacter sp. TY2-98]
MMRSEPLLAGLSCDQLRRGLTDAGIEGSHAFIRTLDADYDRGIRVDALLSTLRPDDDLRFVVGSGDTECWVLAERLPWDSEFFGRGIARLNAVVRPSKRRELRADVSPEVDAVDRVLDVARSRGIDYVFAQVDAIDLPTIRMLSASGFELIESRCHYHRPLVDAPVVRHPCRLATPDDAPSLARTAREMVNPFDRFHADPAIAPADADRLMERWVHASLSSAFADATIVPDDPQPEAFCTARYHKEHWTGWKLNLAQPVLSAVSPRHKGWYVKIISELDEHLRSIGAEHSFLITQLTNNAVIRCWEKLGYQFGKGEHVFRRVLP